MRRVLVVALYALALAGCAANDRTADNGSPYCRGVERLPGSRLDAPCGDSWVDHAMPDALLPSGGAQ
jgi:hypothetical protein